MKQYTSFRRFVLDKYSGVDSPEGDFAMDVKADKEFPHIVKDGYEIKWYLKSKGACDDCLEKFEELWHEYKSVYYRGVKP